MDNIIQGSPEWHAIRLGKMTASRVADVIAKTKSGPATSRGNYLSELLLEKLNGVAAEGFTSSAMQWGIDNEPDARAAYQFEKNMCVAQVGFVPHRSIADAGASPQQTSCGQRQRFSPIASSAFAKVQTPISSLNSTLSFPRMISVRRCSDEQSSNF